MTNWVKLSFPDHYHYKLETPLRVSDLNYGSHMSNEAALVLMGEARVSMLSSLGYSEVDIDGVGIIMSDSQISYRGEGFYGDQLSIYTVIENLSSVRFEMKFKIVANNRSQIIAFGAMRFVFFDYNQRKVSRVRKSTIEKLSSLEKKIS